jgi:hypothetical protein
MEINIIVVPINVHRVRAPSSQTPECGFARGRWWYGWTDGMAYEIEIARAQAQQLL